MIMLIFVWASERASGVFEAWANEQEVLDDWSMSERQFKTEWAMSERATKKATLKYTACDMYRYDCIV